ncbi:MAG: hypothetical protein ACYSWU_20235 [Planctomycetota bacterium]|jgi:hypothetical protein
MDTDKKTILYKAVKKYLEVDAPDRLEEFEIVFDDVCDAIEQHMREKPDTEETAHDRGIPFDAGMVAGTVISVACWIGFSLLAAVAKYSAKQGIPPVLDRVEAELAERGVDRNTLRKMRGIVQGVLEEL